MYRKLLISLGILLMVLVVRTQAATPLADVTADISGFSYTPRTITIIKGSSITWTNQDSANHSVTDSNRTWDSGLFAETEQFTRRFDTIGSFNYFCTLHPFMTGTINVTAAPTYLPLIAR